MIIIDINPGREAQFVDFGDTKQFQYDPDGVLGAYPGYRDKRFPAP
jgi:hypothetical protein